MADAPKGRRNRVRHRNRPQQRQHEQKRQNEKPREPDIQPGKKYHEDFGSRPIGYNPFEELVDTKEALEIAQLFQSNRGILALLKQTEIDQFNSRQIPLFLRAIQKMSLCDEHLVTETLLKLRHCGYLKSMVFYVLMNPKEAVCLEIIKVVKIYIEKFSYDSMSSDSTIMVLHNGLKLLYSKNAAWMENEQYILAHQKEAQQKENTVERVTRKVAALHVREETRPPPNDFRQILLFPDSQELFKDDEDIYLRKNIVKGAYTDIEHYLDILFRLTREDFMRPLRDGVQLYLKDESRKNFDIRVYKDVTIGPPVTTRKGMAWIIYFSPKKQGLKKALMFGSLILLSNNEFQSLICGTVLSSSESAKGEVTISIQSGQLHQQSTYVMVESTAFFEPYKHVLKQIQNMNANNVPFLPYLIGEANALRTNSHGVRYLRNQDNIYNLTSIMGIDYERFGANIHIAKKVWEHEAKMKPTGKQLEAIKAAIKNELCLIQGPPGTGKTFVALQIMKVFLDNSRFWIGESQNTRKRSPIMIVCYTNHALDQFMEQIVDHCPDSLLRFGSRSKSDKLQEFSISNYRKLKQESRGFSRTTATMRALAHQDFKAAEKLMEKGVRCLEDLDEKISDFDTIVPVAYREKFKDVMQKNLKEEFGVEISAQHEKTFRTSLIKEWLGVGPMKLAFGWSLTNENSEKKKNEEENGEKKMNEEENDVKVDAAADNTEVHADSSDEEEGKRKIDGLDDHIEEARERNKSRNDNEIKKEIRQQAEAILQNVQNSNGWQIQNPKKALKKMNNIVKVKLRELRNENENNEEITKILFRKNAENIAKHYKLEGKMKLATERRWETYKTFVAIKKDEILEGIFSHTRNFEDCVRQMELAAHCADVEICEDMKVIGMTTTAAARNIKIIEQIGCKIVMCEEAAEVLESHIVSVLTKHCQQLILIGDHQQLRPKSTTMDLEVRYNLDISLFERLIKNDFDSIRLDEQRRMRPEISYYVRNVIYLGLTDHPCTEQNPVVQGCLRNVQFVDYNINNEDKIYEDSDSNSTSKTNKIEAKFVVALALFFLKNGFKERQITILTFYLGQQKIIRDLLHKRTGIQINPMLVAVQTVDNYQGQENDIIILSCVRSNKRNSGGFSTIENRINVALSRARNGLFVVGNIQMLSKARNHLDGDNVWSKIRKLADDRGDLMTKGIELVCPRHTSYIKYIPLREVNNFADYFPQGGCTRKCDIRLPCGHTCPWTCHDPDNHNSTDAIKCTKPCQKKCELGHETCKLKCFQKCHPCTVMVIKTLPCFHKKEMACGELESNAKCTKRCQKTLSCFHRCPLECTEDCDTAICETPVAKHCEHCLKSYQVKCHESKDAPCNRRCPVKLLCGHSCFGTCSTCHNGLLHINCEYQCGRRLVCGHICNQPCHKVCPPCDKKCSRSCTHSKCDHMCWEACIPCKEKCAKKNCSNNCSDFECAAEKEMSRCPKKLACEHQCLYAKHDNKLNGILHDAKKCAICNIEKQDNFYDPIMMCFDQDEIHEYLQDCRHSIPIESMDQYVRVEMENSELGALKCPKCTTAINKTYRYVIELNIIQVKYEKVKEKYRTINGTVNIKELRQELMTELNSSSDIPSEEKNSIRIALKKSTTGQILEMYRVIILLLKETYEVWNEYQTADRTLQTNIGKRIVKPEGAISELFKECKLNIISYLVNIKNVPSEQNIEDLKDMIKKCIFLSRLDKILRQNPLELSQSHITDAYNGVIEIRKNYYVNVERRMEQLLADIHRSIGSPYDGISKRELTQIKQALGLQQGHWFECPNGHPYTIGQCGGAMVTATCHCGAQIGGNSHRLRGDNRVATNMDGATEGAYQRTVRLNLPYYNQ